MDVGVESGVCWVLEAGPELLGVTTAAAGVEAAEDVIEWLCIGEPRMLFMASTTRSIMARPTEEYSTRSTRKPEF